MVSQVARPRYCVTIEGAWFHRLLDSHDIVVTIEESSLVSQGCLIPTILWLLIEGAWFHRLLDSHDIVVTIEGAWFHWLLDSHDIVVTLGFTGCLIPMIGYY